MVSMYVFVKYHDTYRRKWLVDVYMLHVVFRIQRNHSIVRCIVVIRRILLQQLADWPNHEATEGILEHRQNAVLQEANVVFRESN